MNTPSITSQLLVDEIAGYFPATLTEDESRDLITAPDGIPVSILKVDWDECDDPTGTSLRIETGTPDDAIIVNIDLSKYASTSPDAQLCDALSMHDRAVADILTDEADEILRAMAGDWVHDIGVTIRASRDSKDGRGFEIVTTLSGSDLVPDQWPNPYEGRPVSRPLTAEHAAQIAALALDLEGRIQDAWVDPARDAENDLTVWQDFTLDGVPITWVSADADDADDHWPSIGVTTDLADDGCDLTATVWVGPYPRDKFSVAAMTPRQALHEALERLLDRDLPDTRPGDGLLARWSREAAVCA